MAMTDTANDQEPSVELLEGKQDKPRIVSASAAKPPPLFFSKRLLVTTLLFLGFTNFQILRNNINIAVVEMTSNKTIVQGNTTTIKPPEFTWDSATVGIIISVINYGGLLSFFNGFLIEKLGGSVSCAACTFFSGLLTLLHPIALSQGMYVFLATRFLAGIFEAGFYGSTSEVTARWYPVKERSTLIGYSFNGTNAGLAIVYPFCGFLAHTWGWKTVFYVTGIESIILSVIFFIYVKNQPSQDKTISKRELEYILQDNEPAPRKRVKGGSGFTSKMKTVFNVFKPILTSPPVWSLFMLMFTYMWMATVITACLPLYVKDITGKESDVVGYLSSIPNIIFIFLYPIAGALLDYWKNHTKISTTMIHKIVMSTAYMCAIILFTAVTFVSHVTTSLLIFVLIQVLSCAAPLIIPIISVHLAPNHISHVTSISVNFFSFGAIGAQTTTGFLTTHHTAQEWNNCFYLTSAVALIGALIFLIWGSSETQKWSTAQPTKQDHRSSVDNGKTNDSLI